jgi:RHS repeat-associated protein
VPLAQLAWTENAQPQAQATRAYGQAQRTGTHDEIIGGLDEALAGVEGYGASNGNNANYKKNSKEQPLTLTNAYLTSSNVSTQNHASATVSYYHCDQIGTPRELTDALGAVTWSATYKAWGRVEKEQSYKGLSLASSDGEVTSDYASSQAAEPQQTHQPLRFQGQYYDVETGLHYNRFRYYEPDVSFYLSPDPISLLGGVHLTSYASNPTGWADPLGLSGIPLPGTLTINRIGGGSVANLMLKEAERALDPPGISSLIGADPCLAANQMRKVFPKATKLLEATKLVASATVQEIRAAGFDVIADPTKNFPNHTRIVHPKGAAGFTPENLAKLSKAFADKPCP